MDCVLSSGMCRVSLVICPHWFKQVLVKLIGTQSWSKRCRPKMGKTALMIWKPQEDMLVPSHMRKWPTAVVVHQRWRGSIHWSVWVGLNADEQINTLLGSPSELAGQIQKSNEVVFLSNFGISENDILIAPLNESWTWGGAKAEGAGWSWALARTATWMMRHSLAQRFGFVAFTIKTIVRQSGTECQGEGLGKKGRFLSSPASSRAYAE